MTKAQPPDDDFERAPADGLRPGVELVVLPSEDAVAAAAADRVERAIARAVAAGRRAVLGLATGRSMRPVYAELVRRHREEGLSFAEVETFGLDEYWPIGLRDAGSFHRFQHDLLFDQVDLPPGRRHVIRGDLEEGAIEAFAADYERRLRAAGGVDLQLLGVGRNGHLGFNEPGAARDSRTRLVALAPATREDASGAFGEEGVPRYAITQGLGTILEARALLCVALGEAKAEAVRRALEGPIDPACPASFLRLHPRATLLVDAQAAGLLARP